MADDTSDYLILASTAGDVRVPGDALLVFLDETGGEHLADPSHPVFGLGGCLVRADAYGQALDAPWRELKAREFPDVDGPLHASARQFNTPQMSGLSAFFRTAPIGRFAAVISNKTKIGVSHPNFQLVVGAAMKRIDAIALTFWPITEAHFVVESAQRTNSLVRRFLGVYDRIVVDDDSHTSPLPVFKYFADKSSCLAGLEVADFIIHTAGACVRKEANKRESGRCRRDFQDIFCSVGSQLASFIDVSAVTPGPAE
jgi:Protein of unknown function (DUF3800)